MPPRPASPNAARLRRPAHAPKTRLARGPLSYSPSVADLADGDERVHLESAPSAAGLARVAEALGGGVVEGVVRLGGGLDCATHRFELGRRSFVLKRAKPGSDGIGDEFENLRFAKPCRVPTPEPIACDANGEWFGTPALIMSTLPGTHNLFPDDLALWVGQLAKALAAIHDTPVPGFPTRHPSRLDRWEPWTSEPDERVTAISGVVRELRVHADPSAWVFSHDDFHPGNCVFTEDLLTGVVDWAHATLEPRASAVAFCRKDLAIHPGGDTPDRFLAAYEAENGARVEDMDLWDILQGAGGLQWGHRWPPAFREVGVELNAGDVVDASARFVDDALIRRRLGR